MTSILGSNDNLTPMKLQSSLTKERLEEAKLSSLQDHFKKNFYHQMIKQMLPKARKFLLEDDMKNGVKNVSHDKSLVTHRKDQDENSIVFPMLSKSPKPLQSPKTENDGLTFDKEQESKIKIIPMRSKFKLLWLSL